MRMNYCTTLLLLLTVGLAAVSAAPVDGAPPEPIHNTTTAIPPTKSTTINPNTTTPATTPPTTPPTTPTTITTTTTPTTTPSTTTSTTPPTSTTTAKPNSTTTLKPVPPSPAPTKPTVAPGPITTAVPPNTPTGRHFDGLSFMGGIIMTACLVGLSVGSYKFYKMKTERSYRTL